ncbi:hypothetical protein PQ478_10010 [Alkalihalophilus pseudofirmus]|uniref:hypothetical protein n=1 Tax=Alkalihalophilus pseudofirmus TaxID=79885 RepID=UPI00259B8026|nr:hypothetical protein [Alkalihalophilus pseudofirmus]WEG18797.1 hypothetical protein PQ478_10010 [Alkalihalophilus pseudofirmus]
MKKKISYSIIQIMILSMVFTAFIPGLNALAEEGELIEDVDITDYLVDDTVIPLVEQSLFYDNATDEGSEFDQASQPIMEPMVAPLVPFAIAAAVRLVTQWVGKQAVKNVTKHAAQRAAERKISSTAFAQAMAYGTKYVDKNTGAKILYHSGNKVALVLDKTGKTVVTTYKQTRPKAVWQRQNW